MLAALTTPIFLWAGMGAVGLPILIHLLARRRYRRVRWAAIDFLLEAQRENRKRMRLREWILLAMRCLAVLLIGLLLARPFVAPTSLASVLAGEQRTRHLFILDDSFSMAFARGRDNTFHIAVETVRQRIRGLADHSPGDAVSILSATRPHDATIDLPTVDVGSLPPVMDRLDALAATSRRADWDGAIDAAAAWAAEADAGARSIVYLVSDFQRPDWSPSDPESRFAPLRDLAEQSNGALRVVLADLATSQPENSTVAELTLDRRQVVTGVTSQIVAHVINHGSRSTPAGQMEIVVDDAARPAAPLPAVAPGQEVAVPFDLALNDVGLHTIEVQLPPDGLEVDSRRVLAVEAVSALRVLLVDGEPTGDPYDDEVHLLETALRPEGPVFSGIEPRVIEDHELAGIDPSTYDLIVLCNVYRLEADTAEQLTQYVADGGGLVIFLGDQVDAERYNTLLYADGRGPLPAQIGEVVTVPADRPGASFATVSADHPVLRVYAGDENPFARGIHVWNYFALSPAAALDDGEPLESQPTTDAARVDAGPARTVLRFDDEAATPAWVERTYGEGLVVLVGTAADNEWSDWPSNPSFIVTALELTQYACRAGDWRNDVTVGSPIRWRHRPDRQGATATVRPPGYPSVAAGVVQAQENSETKRSYFVWDRTDSPGVYRLVTEVRGGEEVSQGVAVNVDPIEGDLTPAGEDRLLALVDPIPCEYIRGPTEAPTEADAGGRELWLPVLILAMGLLMAEQFLGWFFGRVR